MILNLNTHSMNVCVLSYLATGLQQLTFDLPEHDWSYNGQYTITNVRPFQGQTSGLCISAMEVMNLIDMSSDLTLYETQFCEQTSDCAGRNRTAEQYCAAYFSFRSYQNGHSLGFCRECHSLCCQ